MIWHRKNCTGGARLFNAVLALSCVSVSPSPVDAANLNNPCIEKGSVTQCVNRGSISGSASGPSGTVPSGKPVTFVASAQDSSGSKQVTRKYSNCDPKTGSIEAIPRVPITYSWVIKKGATLVAQSPGASTQYSTARFTPPQPGGYTCTFVASANRECSPQPVNLAVSFTVTPNVEFKTTELIRPLHEQTIDAENWLTANSFDKARLIWTITKVEGVQAAIDQDGDITFGAGAGIYTVRATSSDLSTSWDEFTLMVLDWVLGAHSNAGPGDSFTAGHAWITITDFSENSGTWVGLGLYADSSTTIVNLGLDNGDGTDVRTIDAAYGRYNRYYFLNPQEKQSLTTYISPARNWTYWYTCASFAESAVMAATGEDVDADDNFGFETPRKLGESIQLLESTDPTSKLNPLNGGKVNTSSSSSSFPQ